jgi:hypothetical protein
VRNLDFSRIDLGFGRVLRRVFELLRGPFRLRSVDQILHPEEALIYVHSATFA